MGLKVYNTIYRAKKKFLPINKNIVRMFVCGPTVYYDIHIGHARSYVFFDIVARYLRWKGYDVFYIQNITDLSEKIVKRAKEFGVSPEKLAQKYKIEYLKDAKKINLISVNKYVLSTSCVKQAINQIKRLVSKGYTYCLDNNIYYATSKFRDYAKLTHKPLKQLRKKIKNQNQKCKNKEDFILWLGTNSKSDINSPFGFGKPGWHIQDTAIAEKMFKQLQYDLHGAGIDCIFPHHCAQIAQIEAISGKKPYVRYWMHNEHLFIKGVKMSKSLNNFLTVKQVLKQYSPQVLRLFLLSVNYRKRMNYTKKKIEKIEKIYERFRLFLSRLNKIRKLESNIKRKVIQVNNLAKKKFLTAIDDDFNTPKAINEITKYIESISHLFKNMGQTDKKLVVLQIREFDKILGIGLFRSSNNITMSRTKI